MDDQNRDPETPAFSGQTWDDRRKRDPESWKALSETPAEFPIVELSEPILIPPAQREHTGTPVSVPKVVWASDHPLAPRPLWRG